MWNIMLFLPLISVEKRLLSFFYITTVNACHTYPGPLYKSLEQETPLLDHEMKMVIFYKFLPAALVHSSN